MWRKWIYLSSVCVSAGLVFSASTGQVHPGTFTAYHTAEGRAYFTAHMSYRGYRFRAPTETELLPRMGFNTGRIDYAHRRDGSKSQVVNDREGSEWKLITLVPERRMITIDRRGTVEMSPMEPWFYDRQNWFSTHPACADVATPRYGKRGTFAGWSEVAGVRVAKYAYRSYDSVAEEYYAPELNCFPLKSVRYGLFWHGIPLSFMIEEVEKIELGEPDPQLFAAK